MAAEDRMADELMTTETIEKGKGMALISWVGLLIGLPLFIIPFATNDNAFATYHARHALVTFLAGMLWIVAIWVVFTAFAFVTCGIGYLLFPLVFIAMLLPLIPTIDGLMKASKGVAEGPIGLADMTRKLFGDAS
jgi:hypothetical protein